LNVEQASAVPAWKWRRKTIPNAIAAVVLKIHFAFLFFKIIIELSRPALIAPSSVKTRSKARKFLREWETGPAEVLAKLQTILR
jgi:hypothetical protein